jgi:hypothetical protein
MLSEEVIEPAIQRAAAQGLAVVELVAALKAEVPFSDDCRGVTVLPQQRCQGHPPCLDHRALFGLQVLGAKRIAPRHQTVSRRHAYRTRRVGIGEPYPL